MNMFGAWFAKWVIYRGEENLSFCQRKEERGKKDEDPTEKGLGKAYVVWNHQGMCFCGQNPSSVGIAAWQTVLQQQELTEVWSRSF